MVVLVWPDRLIFLLVTAEKIKFGGFMEFGLKDAKVCSHFLNEHIGEEINFASERLIGVTVSEAYLMGFRRGFMAAFDCTSVYLKRKYEDSIDGLRRTIAQMMRL